MKPNASILFVLSVSNVANAVKFLSGPEDWASASGFNTTEQRWDDVKWPSQVVRAVAPKRQELKTRAPTIPGSKTVKIRYGPYTVPAPAV
jgi:hypothetical protein